jgi:hypothetical protein
VKRRTPWPTRTSGRQNSCCHKGGGWSVMHCLWRGNNASCRATLAHVCAAVRTVQRIRAAIKADRVWESPRVPTASNHAPGCYRAVAVEAHRLSAHMSVTAQHPLSLLPMPHPAYYMPSSAGPSGRAPCHRAPRLRQAHRAADGGRGHLPPA